MNLTIVQLFLLRSTCHMGPGIRNVGFDLPMSTKSQNINIINSRFSHFTSELLKIPLSSANTFILNSMFDHFLSPALTISSKSSSYSDETFHSRVDIPSTSTKLKIKSCIWSNFVSSSEEGGCFGVQSISEATITECIFQNIFIRTQDGTGKGAFMIITEEPKESTTSFTFSYNIMSNISSAVYQAFYVINKGTSVLDTNSFCLLTKGGTYSCLLQSQKTTAVSYSNFTNCYCKIGSGLNVEFFDQSLTTIRYTHLSKLGGFEILRLSCSLEAIQRSISESQFATVSIEYVDFLDNEGAFLISLNNNIAAPTDDDFNANFKIKFSMSQSQFFGNRNMTCPVFVKVPKMNVFSISEFVNCVSDAELVLQPEIESMFGYIVEPGWKVVPRKTPEMSPSETPNATPAQTPTQSPSESPVETPTQSPSQSLTPNATATPSPQPTPTETPTQSPTETPTESPTETPTETPTESPTESPTPNATVSASPVETPTRSPTPSQSPAQSPAETPSETPTPNATVSASPVETPTESPTDSPSPDQTPSESPTQSPSESATQSPTPSPDPTQTGSQSASHSPSQSPTESPTKSPIQSPDASPSKSDTPKPTPLPTQSQSPTASQSPHPSPDQTPSQSPTQSPTDSPAETPTQTPTQPETASPSPSPAASQSETPAQSPMQPTEPSNIDVVRDGDVFTTTPQTSSLLIEGGNASINVDSLSDLHLTPATSQQPSLINLFGRGIEQIGSSSSSSSPQEPSVELSVSDFSSVTINVFNSKSERKEVKSIDLPVVVSEVTSFEINDGFFEGGEITIKRINAPKNTKDFISHVSSNSKLSVKQIAFEGSTQKRLRQTVTSQSKTASSVDSVSVSENVDAVMANFSVKQKINIYSNSNLKLKQTQVNYRTIIEFNVNSINEVGQISLEKPLHNSGLLSTYLFDPNQIKLRMIDNSVSSQKVTIVDRISPENCNQILVSFSPQTDSEGNPYRSICEEEKLVVSSYSEKESNKGKAKLNGGIVAVIVIGCIGVVAACIAIVYLKRRKAANTIIDPSDDFEI